MTSGPWSRQRRWAPYLFVSPFVALFCVFMLYPLLRSTVLSVHKAAGPDHMVFVGLDNFRFMLDDALFWKAVRNTALYALVFIGIQIPTALGLAMLLDSKGVRCREFFRCAFFSPHLVGGVFVAVLFMLLLSPRRGLVNRLVGAITPFGNEINWLGRADLAMPALIICSLWLSVGYAMIYFLAALQAVDREQYEAAEIDGAGPWARFLHITLPGIRPTLVFMLLVGTIGAFQLFELPYVLFNGAGPNGSGLTIVMYLFQQGFETGNIGYAAAIGWVLVLLVLAITLLQVRLSRATQEP